MEQQIGKEPIEFNQNACGEKHQSSRQHRGSRQIFEEILHTSQLQNNSSNQYARFADRLNG
jgi:hypothetical protein